MNNELYHYGVKGMKWGVRRARRKEARSYQRRLNRLDKAVAEETASNIRADRKAVKYAVRASKYDVFSRREENASRKFDKADSDARRHEANTAKLLKEIGKITMEATNKGYKVSHSDVIRSTKRGEQYATWALGGPLAYATVSSIQFGKTSKSWKTDHGKGQMQQTPWMVSGTKYKVK